MDYKKARAIVLRRFDKRTYKYSGKLCFCLVCSVCSTLSVKIFVCAKTTNDRYIRVYGLFSRKCTHACMCVYGTVVIVCRLLYAVNPTQVRACE